MSVQTRPAVEICGVSDAGPVRDHNEDAFATTVLTGESGATHISIVADGLGGHQAGEVASRLAVAVVLTEAHKEGAPIGDRFLGRALQQANLEVINKGHDDPECFNMQTTMTALAFQHDRLLLAHVGDCRAYRVRRGTIQQLTTDHTRITEMLRMRLVTPEQALKHPYRSMLTRSLGADLILQVDTVRDQLLPGDFYVTCSDGLWSEVNSEELRHMVTESATLEEACQRLIALGTSRESADNMTITIARVHEVTAVPAAVPRWKSWLGRGAPPAAR